MRYFIVKAEETFMMFEADDELTQYRTIRMSGINIKHLKINNGTEISEKCVSDWCPITNEEYFLATRDEISDVDAFASLL